MDKSLTIIVPSYNMESYLPKCLSSLIIDDRGLLQKLDVVIVNDGSNDRTSQIAHEFELKYPDVFRVIDKGNGHYGSCVNAGLAIAAGFYVRLLDADDYFDRVDFKEYMTSISTIVELHADVDLVLNDCESISANCQIFSNHKLQLLPNKVLSLDDVCSGGEILLNPQIAYRTSLVQRIAYHQTEGVPYTDLEWATVPMMHVRRIFYTGQSVYRYLVGRDGQSMCPETYVHSFGTVENIARRIFDEYVRMGPHMPESCRHYMHMRITDILSIPYCVGLIGVNGVRAKVNLVDLDDYIKDTSTDIYSRLYGCVIPGRFRFHYISEWRRHMTDKTIRFRLFRLYSRFAMRLGHYRFRQGVIYKSLRRVKAFFVLNIARLRNIWYETGHGWCPDVMTREETLRKLTDEKMSICRYGDDEFRMAAGRAMSTQKYDAKMHERLKNILENPIPSCICAIPGVFGTLKEFSQETKDFWRLNLGWIRKEVFPLIHKEPNAPSSSVRWGNSQISRAYTDLRDKTIALGIFSMWKRLMQDRNILLVEGRFSRLGYGSDLLDGAASVRRVWCPPLNAFASYDEIYEAIIRHASKDDLILLALGGTATILAYDLARNGYWAVDAGNVDVEYVWMKMGVTKKVPIPGRFIIECSDGRDQTKFEEEESRLGVVEKIL